MATVAHPTTTDKSQNVYYAWLDNAHGTLAKVDNEYIFMADDGCLTTLTPEHFPFVQCCGEVGLADTQHIRDRMRGGAAAIACAR
jgi:hypothetical protein